MVQGLNPLKLAFISPHLHQLSLDISASSPKVLQSWLIGDSKSSIDVNCVFICVSPVTDWEPVHWYTASHSMTTGSSSSTLNLHPEWDKWKKMDWCMNTKSSSALPLALCLVHFKFIGGGEIVFS